MVEEGRTDELFEYSTRAEALWKKTIGRKTCPEKSTSEWDGGLRAPTATCRATRGKEAGSWDPRTRFCSTCMTHAAGTHPQGGGGARRRIRRPDIGVCVALRLRRFGRRSAALPIAHGQSHQKEKEAYELGPRVLFHRAGLGNSPATAAMAREEGKAIRLRSCRVARQTE